MFIKILLKYILGYVRITVEGYYIERFINICTTSKILIWNLKREKGVRLYLNIGIKDFFEAVKIAKKLKCKVKITQKRGIPFLVHKYKKRKIFVITLLVVTILIGISTKYVWNINIQIDSNMEMIGIEEDVKEAGLNVGMKKEKINVQEIANKIRLKRNDISWIGIELKGTNAIVRVVKAKEAPEIVDEKEYSNIIAKKSGVITKIIAQNGTAMVNIGDEVEENQILIAGQMEGKYTGVRYMHASGDIEAKVWYIREKTESFIQQEKVKTNEVENKYALTLNKKTINFYKTISKFKKYDTMETKNKIKILNNFYLPIEFKKITNYEYRYEQKQYTGEQLQDKIIQELEEQMKNDIENKQIVNRNIIAEPTEKELKVKLIYEVIEKIGVEQKLVS